MGHNLPEWVLLEYGAALAGLTLVTVNPSLQPAEARYVLGASRAAGLFLVPEVRGNPLAVHAKAIGAELPELRLVLRLDLLDELMAAGTGSRDVTLPVVSPDDPVQIQYTSGTTGFPKGECCATAASSTMPGCGPTAWRFPTVPVGCSRLLSFTRVGA